MSSVVPVRWSSQQPPDGQRSRVGPERSLQRVTRATQRLTGDPDFTPIGSKENAAMTTPPDYSSGRLPLISLTAAAAVAAVHHVYRLGPEVLVAAVIITVLPYLLLRHYRSFG